MREKIGTYFDSSFCEPYFTFNIQQLYEKMTAVPQEITPEQRALLTPVQEVIITYIHFHSSFSLQLLLHIMKRDSNVIPALFVATEINNMTRQRALMFSVSSFLPSSFFILSS